MAADSDGDGLSDPAELTEHGTLPNQADSDGDGQDDRMELLVGTDPNDADASFSLLEIGRVGFEEAALGSRDHLGGEELGWSIEVRAGAPVTVDTLEGEALPDRQLLLHNGSMIWRSAVIPLGGFSHPRVRMDTRIFQTSSGIESNDFIELKVALSRGGGNTFGEEWVLLAVEGTRTGASGGPRAPLEEVFAIDAPPDGPFITFASEIGDLPEGITHLQVIIDASNNSASERFLFDNLVVEGVSLVDPGLDSDGDGLKDLAEIQLGLDPDNALDAESDLDGDGLSNRREWELGTVLSDSDSDGDGLSDGEEVTVQETDPRRRDSDGDGLSDDDEVALHGTDPKKVDSDGDGFGDALELRYGGDPLVADSAPPFGPPNALGFVWFEEASVRDRSFAGESTAELAWTVSGQATELGVIDVRDGVPLPDQQLLVHSGSLTLITDPVPVSRPEDVVVSVDGRVYQTSSGIESVDTIDIKLQWSEDGDQTFPSEAVLLAVEGTRTGASGNPRTALEDVFAIDDPADGPFVTVTSERGTVPAGSTHVRVVIEAVNNSTSERFVFDHINVWERPTFTAGQDTDNDGIPDAWEFDHGFDRADATDADADGLSNRQEFVNGSDPRSADSDGDGLSDFAEVTEWQTDPAVSDSDQDGLSDAEEVSVGTDPTKAGTDGDGWDDRVEVVLGGDPLSVDPEFRLGPDGALAFTGFEQPLPEALGFTSTGAEMGWDAAVAAAEAGVTRTLGCLTLPNQALFVHNGLLSFQSEAVPVDTPETAVVSVSARVYQESSGIESDDFIVMWIEASGDGESFEALTPFLAIEGIEQA